MLAYHFTHTDNVSDILKSGLKVNFRNPKWGHSGSLSDDWEEFYGGVWPVFLTLANCEIEYLFNEFDWAIPKKSILTVDISGYDLYPDFPTYQTEFNRRTWEIKSKKLQRSFYEAAQNRQTPKPKTDLAYRFIRATRTFAIVQDIPAERISL